MRSLKQLADDAWNAPIDWGAALEGAWMFLAMLCFVMFVVFGIVHLWECYTLDRDLKKMQERHRRARERERHGKA